MRIQFKTGSTECLQEGDEDGEEGGEGQSITRDEELIKVSTQTYSP